MKCLWFFKTVMSANSPPRLVTRHESEVFLIRRHIEKRATGWTLNQLKVTEILGRHKRQTNDTRTHSHTQTHKHAQQDEPPSIICII